MSQQLVPDANTGRKRHGSNDVALHRHTKKRNVVDSSPTSGQSQPEIFEDWAPSSLVTGLNQAVLQEFMLKVLV